MAILLELSADGVRAFLPTIQLGRSMCYRGMLQLQRPGLGWTRSVETLMKASVSGGGFKPKGGSKKGKSGGGERPQRWLEEDAESAPDGEEEVIELNMPVEELIDFAERLEAGYKAVSKKHDDSQPMVILNATGLHWILCQVRPPVQGADLPRRCSIARACQSTHSSQCS